MHLISPNVVLSVMTLTVDHDAYNIRTAAGNPIVPKDILVIVPAIVVGAGAPGNYALRTGSGWPTGTRITLINHGSIEGFGGGGNGQNGGDALYIEFDVAIDNTDGYIRGGGGGGAQGRDYQGYGGGGGGGGMGNPGGTGGAGSSGAGSGYSGQNGSDGSRTVNGGGGAGGFFPLFPDIRGGTGGAGGPWGRNGQVSGPNTDNEINSTVGMAGYAVRTNGRTVTWLAGNNAEQVVGSVG